MKDGGQQEGVEKIDVLAFDGETYYREALPVIREILLDVFVNEEQLVTIACTGNFIEELTLGYLKQEGIIDKADDVVRIRLSNGKTRVDVATKQNRTRMMPKEKRHRSLASSGARGSRLHGAENRQRISPAQAAMLTSDNVLDFMADLLGRTALHHLTRGTHCSALADPRGVLIAREDIGRHNTLDMLSGYILLHNLDCSDKILLTTGRVSSEIVSKTGRMGIPVIISHSASTSKAIPLASQLGITVIGYVRERKFKVYCGPERVKVEAQS
jgi:FdhD protein